MIAYQSLCAPNFRPAQFQDTGCLCFWLSLYEISVWMFLVHCLNSGMYFAYPNRDLTCPVVSDVIYSVSFNMFTYVW